MSVNGIRLRNFRGFPDLEIELKPLTVLLGPNSSGKSSVSTPLAALAHCQRIYSGQRHASLTPETSEKARLWPIDLGGYQDVVNSGSTDRVYVDLRTSEGWVEFGFGLVPVAPDELWFSHLAYPADVDRITGGEGTSSSGIVSVPAEAKPALRSETKSDAVVDVGFGTGSYLDKFQSRGVVIERINEQQWQQGGKNAHFGFSGLMPLSLQDSNRNEIKFNRKSLNEIESLLAELVYIRGVRERPIRGYPRFRSEQKSVGYAGEKTASVLLNRREQMQIFVRPPKVDGNLVRWQEHRSSLEDALSNWLRHLGLADAVFSSESVRYGTEYVDLRLRMREGGATRGITEIGFAVSQVLPVLVGGLLQPKDRLLIVDLPEAHLHPRPQGDIADLFCSMAMAGRSALVETHSEMFFHRLRLRAAMEPNLLDRICVYFFDAPDQDGKCRPPRKVGLSFEEELEWPSGFLREALDTEIQISAVRNSK